MVGLIKVVHKISQEEFLEAYMKNHRNNRGECFKTNADRLFNYLRTSGYIEAKEG